MKYKCYREKVRMAESDHKFCSFLLNCAIALGLFSVFLYPLPEYLKYAIPTFIWSVNILVFASLFRCLYLMKKCTKTVYHASQLMYLDDIKYDIILEFYKRSDIRKIKHYKVFAIIYYLTHKKIFDYYGVSMYNSYMSILDCWVSSYLLQQHRLPGIIEHAFFQKSYIDKVMKELS